MSSTTALDPATSAARPAPPTVRAPRWPILGATAALVLSGAALGAAIVGDLRGAVLLTGLGYLCGAVGVSLLVVVHRMLRRRAARSPRYEPRRRLAAAARGVLTLGLLVGLANAYLLATEIAKR